MVPTNIKGTIPTTQSDISEKKFLNWICVVEPSNQYKKFMDVISIRKIIGKRRHVITHTFNQFNP